MDIILKEFWAVLILVTIMNGFLLKNRLKEYIQKKPELQKGYDDYVKGYLIFLNIPWIIMGIGNLSGLTNDIQEFFTPRLMNPIVLTFHASLVICWTLSFRWIYFKNGAEFIEKHPGLVERPSLSGNSTVTARQVKIFYPLMLLVGIFALVMMWTMDNPHIVL